MTSSSTCSPRCSSRSRPTSSSSSRPTRMPSRVLPNLVGVEPVSGVDPDDAGRRRSPTRSGGVEALDRDTAVASLPGVSSIQQSFAIILGLAFVVVILLTGFFFLIITVQKMSSLTLLRAVGASSGFLVREPDRAGAPRDRRGAAGGGPAHDRLAVNGAASAQFTATVEPTTVITTSVAILRVRASLAALGAMRRVAQDRSRGGDHPPRRGRPRMKLAWRELIRRPSRFLTAGSGAHADRAAPPGAGRHPRRADQVLDRPAQSTVGAPDRLQRRQQGLDRPLADHRGSSTTRSPRVPGVHEATGLGIAPPRRPHRGSSRSPPTSPCSATRPPNTTRAHAPAARAGVRRPLARGRGARGRATRSSSARRARRSR